MIRPTHAVIDRTALRANLEVIRRHVGRTVRVMAVVKSNCYGHDATICIPELAASGIDTFGVATVEEGIALRRSLPTERIVVLPPPLPPQLSLFVEHELEAVVSTLESARALSGLASAAGREVDVHLHIDTGMARNGAPPEEALDILERLVLLPSIRLKGICSHFATSDVPDDAFVLHQIDVFDTIVRRALSDGYRFDDIHLANSGGVLNYPASHYTLVRPGLALYGYHPTMERQASSELEPVMTLRTIVSGIKRYAAGTSISYGRRFTTDRESTIGTLPIGYADGYMRALTNRSEGIVGGVRRRLVGTICMDETMIELGNDAATNVGDEVILIGRADREAITAWDLATAAGTIPYEICTNVSARVPRLPRE